MKRYFHWTVAAGLMLAGMTVHAQEPVVGAADRDALFHDKNPRLNTNKQAAYHIVKDLIEAGHWDEADKNTSPSATSSTILRPSPAAPAS